VLPTGANQQSRFCPELRYHALMFHYLNTVRATRLAIVTTILAVSFSAAFVVSADARGGGHEPFKTK
jgi:hypothetical protein